MKKTLKIISLMLVLCIALCACGSNNETNTKFSHSKPYDENGYWNGIKASDYVQLPDIEKISIDKSQIDEQIAMFLAYYPNTKDIYDRAVVDGDSLNIDYIGSVDGVEFEGGSTGGKGTVVTIGVTNYIEGFLEQLIGHFPGEIFDINVTFPEDYSNADLAGKAAVFNIKINNIVEYVNAEWNDDFVATNLYSNYGWQTAAEAEENMKTVLVEDHVLENSTWLKEIPQEMVDYLTDLRLNYYEGYAAGSNIEINSFLQYYKIADSVEDFRTKYKEEAVEGAKFNLIYQAVAEKLGYTVSTDEVSKYFMDLNDTDDYSEYEKAFGMPYIKAIIMYEKMSNKLLESAEFK